MDETVDMLENDPNVAASPSSSSSRKWFMNEIDGCFQDPVFA
jgi:hypothetical protein